ncbi:MAG TPA: Bax inhibitor-1/YccA family protein, partial [Chitinophagales bacterium]|nr:Bax inhibitor-1/YccA family protein [Chitinophagales bacterium]
MALFSRTSNPTLSDSRFEQYVGIEVSRSEQMTIEGTINKTALLLAIIVGITVFMFYRVISTGDMSLVSIAMPMGAIGGFITAIVIIFKNTWANYLAPVYAIFEGFFIGAISIYFEASYPGIAFQAAGLTFGTMGAL